MAGKFFGTLRRRLLLSYLAVTLLALGTVLLLAFFYLERSALERERSTLLSHAAVVAGVSTQYMVKQHDYLEFIARDYGRHVEARVLILDGSGQVLRDSHYEDGILGRSLAARPEVAGALAGRRTSRLERVEGVGRTLYAAGPVLEQGKPIGAVLVVGNVEPVFQQLAPVRRLLVTVSGAALALAAAVGWMLARSLARPVTVVTEGVQAIASGDLSYRVPVTGNDELARLAVSFNQMADRLARMESSRRAFVANAAHELRTPLAGLKALVEPLLSGAVTDPREQAEFLADVGREVDRLSDLAVDLLTLSDLEAGRPLQRSPVDLEALLARVRERLTPLAREGRVQVVLTAPDPRGGGSVAHADSLKLERALYNLVHNAISFSPADSAVRLGLEAEPECWVITVADQGPGIPPEDLPHIFERFYRSERSRSRERGGAGLGLAIAREIIQSHAGAIRVESKPGEGTRFVAVLPTAT